MLKKIIKRLSIFALIGFLILFLYLRFGGYFFLDSSLKKELIELIETSPNLPERFYELYEVAYPKSLENNYLRYIIDKQILEKHESELPSISIAYNSNLGWSRFAIKQIMLTFYIEDKTTQKECLNFYAQDFDFLYKNVGVERASLFYFEKELENLNDREMMSLIVMMKNPSLYNPIRKPERVETKVEELLSSIQKVN